VTEQTPDLVPPVDDWSRLLDGRVALVTGGGDGIGGAVVRLFAQHGAHVVVAERDPDRAAAIATTTGVESHIVDVTDQPAVEAVVADVTDRLGGVDVLVNNVGDYRPSSPFPRSTPETWGAMYDHNLGHVLGVTRAVIGSMIERRRGSIVNVHSVEAMRGFPPDPVYAAMKAATAHFTTSLAVAVGRYGIRVNGIGPDLTQTPQVDYLDADGGADANRWETWAPVGRVGWPEDQARVVLFLASDAAAFVTGHNVPVDGGTLAGGGWFYSPSRRRFVNRPVLEE